MKRIIARLMVICLVLLPLGCLAEGEPTAVTLGRWEQDNDLANGPEPMEWLVLGEEDGRVLLMTRFAIDSRQFHHQWQDTTWAESQLRAWLNEDFIGAAFTPEEQAAILPTAVETPDNMSYKTSGGESTVDRVFLLSIEEAKQYLPSAKARQARGTAWAQEQQLYVKQTGANAGCCWWWLRTMGQTADTAAYVKDDGAILFKGYDVDFYSGGVRPVMWVDRALLDTVSGQ